MCMKVLPDAMCAALLFLKHQSVHLLPFPRWHSLVWKWWHSNLKWK